jgi:medium-chain acyl-[acyl-carrier-protein] hydrolase
MEKDYSKQYRVRVYEADFRGTVRPVTILDYLQDTASEHSTSTGCSVKDLRTKNMTWVLSRYHIRFLRYPMVGEVVRARTWRSSMEGFFALREFEITDTWDKPLVLATSSWVIMSLETKRPVRIDTVVTDLPIIDYRVLSDDFNSLPRLEDCDMEQAFNVRPCDLDANLHVNHTVYAGWAMETVPNAILDGFNPSEIEISYRAEAFRGDTVIARSRQIEDNDPRRFLHQVVNHKDGRELTRMKTAWWPVDEYR